MPGQWSTEEIKQLICEVEERPTLWNVLVDEYRDRVKKSDSWKKVAEALNKEQCEVEKKFHTLRTQYTAEVKAEEKKEVRVRGCCESKSFLGAGMKKRQGTSSEIGFSETLPDGSEKTIEMASTTPTPKKARREPNKDLLAQAVKVLEQPPADALDIFGQYVSMELRAIRGEHIRNRVKRDITMAILRAQELDEQQYSGHSSPLSWRADTPSPSFSQSQASSTTMQNIVPDQNQYATYSGMAPNSCAGAEYNTYPSL